MLHSVVLVAVRSRERTRLSFKARHDLGVGVVDLVVPTGLMSQAQVLHSLELLAREVLPRIRDFGVA